MQADNSQPLPVKLMVLIALVQGLLLLMLHQALGLNLWPKSSPDWLFSFYVMAFAGPLMLLLGVNSGQIVQWFKWVTPITLLLGLAGFYIGYQSTPVEHIRNESLLFAMIISLALSIFKMQMYLQQKIAGGVFTYSNLFRWSWRNFLTVFLSLLFAAAFWGILMLWAGLFTVIGIDFFYNVFTKSWFYYPAIALAYGVGIIIFRRLSHVIDVITRLQQALMKYLLVVLIFVSIIFLVSLAFTGLQGLWNKGGSYLILWLQALILFFVNAVYQDGSESRPYHPVIHRFIYCGILLLPVYSLISFYGLALRIDQYGWSVARCWAMLVWFFLTIFSVGYVWGILKNRDAWLRQLSSINVVVGIVFMVSMILVNSPVLDFRKITVASQLSLLEQGRITLSALDINYFRNQLARPGYHLLQDLVKKQGKDHPEFVSRVNNHYSGGKEEEQLETRAQFVASLKIKANSVPPDALLTLIHNASRKQHKRDSDVRYLTEVDLNSDNVMEYLFAEGDDHWTTVKVYYYENNQWNFSDVTIQGSYDRYIDRKLINTLQDTGVEVISPKWSDLKIGDMVLRVKQ